MTDTPRAKFLYEADVPAWETAKRRRQVADLRRVLNSRTHKVNEALYKMGLTYHQSVPLDSVNSLLMTYGFEALDALLVCGRDGTLHEFVGNHRWLRLTWHKMDSGRYEIVAYVS